MTTQANKHLSLTPTIHRLPSGTRTGGLRRVDKANKHLSLTPTIHRLPSGTHVQVVSYRLTR